MLNYIKSECYRVMHSRSTYVMTGIMAVLPVLFHIILYVTGVASSTTQDFPYDITSFSFSFLAGSPMLFTYAGLIVAAVLYEEEHKNGNMKNAVAFGISREKLFLGKCITAVLTATVIMALVLTAYIGSAWFLLEHTGPTSLKIILTEIPAVYGTAVASMILGIALLAYFKNEVMAAMLWAVIVYAIPRVLLLAGMVLLGQWGIEFLWDFAQLLPADGTLFINGDIENWQEITEGLACRVVTFGTTSASDYYPSDISYNKTADATFTVHSLNGQTRQLTLGVPGEHNISNALAAVALSDLLSIDYRDTAEALLNFHGTDRRFEYKGTINGITIVDDYAHHPTEIAATLHAALNYPHKTLWCIFQPHTYTRTKAFLPQFAKSLALADKVILADIYAARETDTLGISSADLQALVQKEGKECFYFHTFEEIEDFVLKNCINGDLLITMGAGDVVNIGENLLSR